MIHAEYLVGNPITGRKVWLVRHINGKDFGDPWDWSVVVVKRHYFSRSADLKGAMEINSLSSYKSFLRFLADMGFVHAEGIRRNGVLKRYPLGTTKTMSRGSRTDGKSISFSPKIISKGSFNASKPKI